ncbi:MAG: putative 2OG-Fe(II) oxygenase [Pseudomonadota bacterium]
MQQNTIMINEAWPSTFFLCDWGDYADHRAGIEGCIREQAKGFAEPVASNVAKSAKPAEGLVESPLQFFQSTQNADVQAMAQFFAECIKAAVSKVNGSEVPPARLQVQFTESWFHITNKGGFHDAHTHGACSWCGIFYLEAGDADQVPDGGASTAGNGINRFYTPLGQGGMVRDYGNAYLGRNYMDVQPTNGRLVLFPSFLLHSALPYRGETDRIIVSFNSRTRIAPS